MDRLIVIKEMDLELRLGRIRLSILDNGKIINRMAVESLRIHLEIIMKANG